MFALDQDFETPCRSKPELRFSTEPADIERMKKLCGTCRIQLICLEQALDYERLTGETLNGVHGGLTPAERANTKLTRIA